MYGVLPERHILKNNKHSSVPFGWRRGPWVYGTGSQQIHPLPFFSPVCHNLHMGSFSGCGCWRDPGEGSWGGPLGGWKSASPTPAQRHRAPRLSELGCECILTPHTSRSVSARRASRAYVQENKWFRFMLKKLFTFPSKPGNRGHAVFCRCLSDGPTTSFFTASHPRSCDVTSLNGRCFFSGSWLGFCGLGVTFPP